MSCSLLKKRMKQIKQKYASDTRYLVGLSGGLDSRLAAHHAKKEGLDLTSFSISMPDSRENNIIKALAKHFDILNKSIWYALEPYE